MALSDPVFNYCERLEVGLLTEPLNAFSNLAFFIAAYCAYKSYKILGKPDCGVALLITLITIVGVGSSLFHTFANKLTLLADVIPITVFVLCYLYLSLRRLVGVSKPLAALALLVFIAVAASMSQVPEAFRFNGSVDYFPCLVALLLVAWKTKNPEPKKLVLRGAGIFILSLTFRSIDRLLCAELSTGTHFMWHLLNGLLLYTLVKALITDCAPRQSV